ncbi:MAG: pantetheine-phosphate adenylyltransferase [Bacteroidetes Order II. Incertae sedis bacterium]|nr:pantetheine-phosphate adenylyltransferase [Bacteroidetes Order II. bacterium]
MSKLALYAGSFDPFTFGHLDVLEQALQVFDRVCVTVAVNSGKTFVFTPQERCALIREATAHLKGVEVTFFDGLLVNHAVHIGAHALIRGIRQMSDFDYEFRMAIANRRLSPQIATVVFIPNPTHLVTSSSLVREIWHWGGDISMYVPEAVLEALQKKSK